MTKRFRNPLVSLLAVLLFVLSGARVMTSAFGPSAASAADSTVTPPAGAETTPAAAGDHDARGHHGA